MEQEPAAEQLTKAEKYKKAREIIQRTDEEIIVSGRTKSESLGDSGMPLVVEMLEKRNSFDIVKEKLKGKRLFDVGCGKYGGAYAKRLMNLPYKFVRDRAERRTGNRHSDWNETEREELKKDKLFTPSEIVCVDLFVQEKDFNEHALKKLGITFVKNDGLSALLKEPDSSANVLVSTFDFFLLDDIDYHKRLAQEAFRVIPDDGLLVLNNAPGMCEEARKLFKYELKSNAIFMSCFSNTPFPEEFIDPREGDIG